MGNEIPTSITIAAGFSLLLANFPGIRQLFNTLDSQKKVLFIFVSMTLIGVVVFLGANPGLTLQTLSLPALLQLAANIIAAIFASQITNTQVNVPLSSGRTDGTDKTE